MKFSTNCQNNTLGENDKKNCEKWIETDWKNQFEQMLSERCLSVYLLKMSTKLIGNHCGVRK